VIAYTGNPFDASESLLEPSGSGGQNKHIFTRGGWRRRQSLAGKHLVGGKCRPRPEEARATTMWTDLLESLGDLITNGLGLQVRGVPASNKR